MLLLRLLVAASVTLFVSGANTAYVCSFCLIVGGLGEEIGFQIKLQDYLKEKCDGNEACNAAVDALLYAMLNHAKPEDICAKIGMCTQGCTLFSEWPVRLPEPQPDWPIARRKLAESGDLTLLKPFFEEAMGSLVPGSENIPAFAHIALATASITGSVAENACGHNVTCKILAFADTHVPLQDNDGDLFSVPEMKRLRGSHWRGSDCDDKRDDVYPGRKVTNYDSSVDHNCNGIYGGNSTGSYEDLFCAGTDQRGIVILGDSATAHFHIPPSWVTAKNWNGFEQLVPDAMNELDFPMCSWGTGHVTPEECPYQAAVPGVNGVMSLYTQLRNRNRCNHNDFQNIGVNGARMTNYLKNINSFSRTPEKDHPLLVWLALIGNDVCNGHPTFDSMTKPDEFYTHAMEILNAIDAKVPPGSNVIALALFDGELLYETMHAKQHPIGSRYKDVYDLMNCLDENPCWGWLNSNQTVRRTTTKISDELNTVYRLIERTATFKNFKFIFYAPIWAQLFSDYQKAGNELSNLIEATDGFHPSQAGNALFAQKFYEWMETNHPEVLGGVNPHNAEIDALFFNNQNNKKF